MAKTKTEEVYTYRVTPSGDGSYFVWRKYDTDGEEVEEGTQVFTSEADAEKAVRSIITGSDVLAVKQVRNVNEDSNESVVHEVAERPEETHFGAAIKYTTPKAPEGDNPAAVPVETSAMKAVKEGTVADEAGDVERPAAEQKAVDAAQAKADKVAAEEAKKNAE